MHHTVGDVDSPLVLMLSCRLRSVYAFVLPSLLCITRKSFQACQGPVGRHLVERRCCSTQITQLFPVDQNAKANVAVTDMHTVHGLQFFFAVSNRCLIKLIRWSPVFEGGLSPTRRKLIVSRRTDKHTVTMLLSELPP